MNQPNDTDDTFLARWINDALTEKELENFKQSPDYKLFEKIRNKSATLLAPDFDVEKNYKKLQTKLQSKKSKGKVIRLYYQYAVGIAAMLLVGLGLYNFWNQETVYASSMGEKLTYTLPDSSTVVMNGQSTIRLVENEWKNDQRSLKLEGETYFKVKKGSVFTVKTNQGSVTVVGTQFNVLVKNDFFVVECYEGKVRVQKGSSKTLLLPGKGIRFNNNQKETFTTLATEPNWKTNNYVYKGTPLYLVINDLENTYGLKVSTHNINTQKEFTGKLITNNLEKALLLICKPLEIEYTIQDKAVILKAKQ